MRQRNIEMSAVIGGLLATLLSACGGDFTAGTGEKGRLRYVIYTDYEIYEGDLTDARIITGHPQVLEVSLTDKGRKEVDEPGNIHHRLDPAAGVTIDGDSNVEAADYVRPARFTVTDGGQYTLESYVGEEIVDKIELTFEPPAGFEMSMKVRPQWGESFDVVTGDPVVVDEGDQLIILAIPVDSSSQRLAGKMTPTITVDPEWAVTPGHNVYSNTEDIAWETDGPTDYYFIEPTTVTFTVSDPTSGASSDQAFNVQPVDKS